MKAATARSLTFAISETGVPPNFNRALLTAMAFTYRDELRSVPSTLNRARLLNASARVLSELSSQVQRQFSEWLKQLDPSEFQGLVGAAAVFANSPRELFNNLANSLFDEEVAKTKGAIFTPPWLSDRLVRAAYGLWKKLNVGKEPAVAADLSCGPGSFLWGLASLIPKGARIIGIDNCPEYVSLARLLTAESSQVEVHCADTLLTLRSFGQLNLGTALSEIPSNGFDIIVGNPPYVRCQSLDSRYSKALREIYPDFTIGNFDLSNLFLAHTLEALAPGGVGALVISSKFMNSKYGADICRRIGRHARLIEIVDFGDGQVFGGRTTYTCTLTFAKLAPQGACKVLRFPPGLKWSNGDSHLSSAETVEIPAARFQSAPWDLSSGINDEVMRLMRRPDCLLLEEVFPTINQGIRTGANQFFLVPKSISAALDHQLILPYLSGENIRCCQILSPAYSLVWPYKYNDVGAVVVIREEELFSSFPRTASYLSEYRDSLSSRDIEPGSPWYSYSRSQNLDLAHRPKIIGRELMPRAEFAADEDGKFAICSGYALVPPSQMPKPELRMWSAVMCTPTMEFQLRHACTQLHSGWFRILKHQLSTVRLPPFSKSDLSIAIKIAGQLYEKPTDSSLLAELDIVVSRAFGITATQGARIQSYVGEHHKVSTPNVLFEDHEQLKGNDLREDDATGSLPISLSRKDKEKYFPVELPEYYKIHAEREDLRQAVTFVNNKIKPIHRWYGFTQGFSADLVANLFEEVRVSDKSVVYDPFAGSGTTLLACQQSGIASFGAEISPLMCWITRLKTNNWDPTELMHAVQALEGGTLVNRKSAPPVFANFLAQAYSPAILDQVFGWRDWIRERFEGPLRDFLLLGLTSILEVVSQLRKHGSHYRFLNKTDSVGLAKLNIPVISSSAELKPILVEQLKKMIADVESSQFSIYARRAQIFDIDSRVSLPEDMIADAVITSPPYLNRNMYFAQQKAELVLLDFIRSYDDYRALVRKTFRSHVEGALSADARSNIPEVQTIVDQIELTENNNAKIPHMVCGYFEDLQNTLTTLRKALSPGARLAFVVGNCRWGGVVVPVDHLLSMIAERLGYQAERIFVTRLKGNSPQQMRRFGRIPMRESIVLLRWNPIG